MAAAEILEIIRAEEAVKKLNDAIADSRDLIRRTDDAFRQKRIGVKEHTRLVTDEARQIDRNTRALERQQVVIRRGQGPGGSPLSPRAGGYAGFYLSSALNRARQGGFQGALSGIPPLAMLMGAPAGLAGALSLAGGIANQATGGGRNWLGLQKSLEYSYLESWIGQGRAGRMGKAPWAPGNYLHDFSSGFYHYLNRAADPQGPAGGTYVLGPIARWFQQFVGDPTDPALGMDETFDERQARDDQKKEETQRKRESAIETITRMIGSRHGQTTIGSGVQRALSESRLDAETLIDAWLEEDGIGKFAQRGEAAATTERRANLRGDWSRMIERATQGNQRAIADLVEKLRKDTGALGGANELADAIMQWTAPLNEDWLRTKAQEHFTKFAGLFERTMRQAAPTLPELTGRGQEALAGQLLGRMESAGVSPQTQDLVARILTGQGEGKEGSLNPAALSIIVPMLANAGATQREIFEAIPLIAKDVHRGVNVFEATQKVINRLLRGGLRASMRGGRQTAHQMRSRAGLAMLGLDVDAFEGEQSRLFATPKRPKREARRAAAEVQAEREESRERFFRRAMQDPAWAINSPDLFNKLSPAEKQRVIRQLRVIEGDNIDKRFLSKAEEHRIHGRETPSRYRQSTPVGGWGTRQPFIGPPMLGAGGAPQGAKPIREQIADAIAQVGGDSGGPFSTAGLSAADRDKVALGMLPPIPKVNIWPGITDFQLWAQQDERRAEMARQGLFPGTTMQPQYEAAYRAAGTALQGGMLQGEWARKAEAIQQETIAQRERDAAIMDQLINNQAVMAQQLADLSRRSQSQERSARAIGQHLNQTNRTAQNRGR